MYCNPVALFTRAWIEISLSIRGTLSLRVALFTRAWIEMLVSPAMSPIEASRPLHEGVDWNSPFWAPCTMRLSRPLHEGVDWNKRITKNDCIFSQCRPLHEGVDWNDIAELCDHIFQVALFTRAWIEIRLYLMLYRLSCRRPLHEGVDWNLIVFLSMML